MLDREIPPEAEGNADGGGDVARRIAQAILAFGIASN